jgi:hypothetical protein
LEGTLQYFLEKAFHRVGGTWPSTPIPTAQSNAAEKMNATAHCNTPILRRSEEKTINNLNGIYGQPEIDRTDRAKPSERRRAIDWRAVP